MIFTRQNLRSEQRSNDSIPHPAAADDAQIEVDVWAELLKTLWREAQEHLLFFQSLLLRDGAPSLLQFLMVMDISCETSEMAEGRAVPHVLEKK